MAIVLASASPRRKEILQMLGVRDLIVLPAAGAEIVPEDVGPGKAVELISAAKAMETAGRCGPDDLVIAADTVVYADGSILGKPSSPEDAARMLQLLSGRSHQVYTGITVGRNGRFVSEHEVSCVFFRELTREDILGYIATGEPMDKAGAYGAQGIGALLVERIEGDFFNVMGLPVCRLGKMLKEQGVNLL